MTGADDRFRRLSGLFDELVALDPASQEERIEELCADEPQLAEELRALLAADAADAGDVLVANVVESEAVELTASEVEGRTLGSWRVVDRLGEGGMGAVYLAERADGAYEARAALKIVRGGLPDSRIIDRFRAERQILAGLSHPGVAKLLDGGATDDGTPYLVMELVEGLPVTEWCEKRHLSIEERLRLFVQICDAVGHAHAALIAHRDLKPSNILVTSDGEPKLLDFGIAKLMEEIEDGGDGVTGSYPIMTPAYASPERISGARSGVAADIYSLGVILYQLLSGRLPIETGGLTPAQLMSKVTQDVPPLVSSVVEDDVSRRRLSGDLDAIVSTALRKEPAERYPSVEALADDVRLHLGRLPIRARRDDWRYRTGKLLRRNAGVVSGGLLLVLLGITFGVNAVFQARAVARERDRAEAQRVAAEQVSGFLEGLFTEADPNQATASDLTARQLLDRGADRILAELDADPGIQASLALVMGRVFRAIGEYEAAEPLLDSALALRARSTAAEASDLADAYVERGALAYDVGDYESAVDLHRRAVAALEEGAPDDLLRIASSHDWLASSLMELGRMDEAEPHARFAVETYRTVDPGPNAELASALSSFTDVLRTRGEISEALAVAEEALSMTRTVYGDDHPEVAHALNQMASTLRQAGRPEEAIPLVEEGLAIRRRAFDGPHVEVAASLGNLANMLSSVERMDEALVSRQASVDMLREIFPGDHPYLAASTNSLASLLAQMGRSGEAEAVYEESLRAHRASFPEGHPNLGYPLTGLGRIYRERGRLEEAEVVLREAYDVRSHGLPAGHWHVAASGLELGVTLDAAGRVEERDHLLEEAGVLLDEAYTILAETFGEEDARTERARGALRAHLEARGLSERAAELAGEPGA